MAEERVCMASYHLDDAAQLWFLQLQDVEGTPTCGNFKDLLNLRFSPPLHSAMMFELAECHVREPWRSMLTDSRPSYPTLTNLMRHSGFSYSLACSDHRSQHRPSPKPGLPCRRHKPGLLGRVDGTGVPGACPTEGAPARSAGSRSSGRPTTPTASLGTTGVAGSCTAGPHRRQPAPPYS